jgi:maltose-binding protein MalE
MVLTDYIDENKTNEFNHQIIAKLTDDYEFCNLSEAEIEYYLHDANYEERKVYIEYENKKDIAGINKLILEYRKKWGINNEEISEDFRENKKV